MECGVLSALTKKRRQEAALQNVNVVSRSVPEKKEDEASRIARLAKTGRITDGRVIDAASDDDGKILQGTYTYTLAGVQYESSQGLSQSQQQRPFDYAPGRQIVIRYDPGQLANSLVV